MYEEISVSTSHFLEMTGHKISGAIVSLGFDSMTESYTVAIVNDDERVIHYLTKEQYELFEEVFKVNDSRYHSQNSWE